MLNAIFEMLNLVGPISSLMFFKAMFLSSTWKLYRSPPKKLLEYVWDLCTYNNTHWIQLSTITTRLLPNPCCCVSYRDTTPTPHMVDCFLMCRLLLPQALPPLALKTDGVNPVLSRSVFYIWPAHFRTYGQIRKRDGKQLRVYPSVFAGSHF